MPRVPRYRDGRIVKVGDVLMIGGTMRGEVVGMIRAREYAPGYNAIDWNHLRHGILIATDIGDLRLDAPDEDTELVRRKQTGRFALGLLVTMMTIGILASLGVERDD